MLFTVHVPLHYNCTPHNNPSICNAVLLVSAMHCTAQLCGASVSCTYTCLSIHSIYRQCVCLLPGQPIYI